MPQQPIVKSFFDPDTGSWQYVFHDEATRKAAIIDPVLDFDPKSGSVSTGNADRLLAYIDVEGLDVAWIIDTHPHADHFSAAPYLKDKLKAPMATGDKVPEVQQLWKKIYNLGDAFKADGREWDHLFTDGESFKVGDISCRAVLTPGHTSASITIVAGNAAFVHDTLMMPDKGSVRADFPGGDAAALYRSLNWLMTLPDETRLFVGHDYPPADRDAGCETSVAQQKQENVHLKDGWSEADYVAMREKRDAGMALPSLMLAALQVNIRGGHLPPAESNGTSYLKIPLDVFEPPADT